MTERERERETVIRRGIRDEKVERDRKRDRRTDRDWGVNSGDEKKGLMWEKDSERGVERIKVTKCYIKGNCRKQSL